MSNDTRDTIDRILRHLALLDASLEETHKRIDKAHTCASLALAALRNAEASRDALKNHLQALIETLD